MPIAGYSPNWKPGLILIGVGAAALALVGIHLLFVVPGVIAALMGFSSIWPQLASSNYRICPGGVVFWRLRRVECCPWSQVRTIEFTRKTQTMYGWSLAGSSELSGKLVRQDDRRFLLRWLTPPLISLIEQETYRVLLPRAREDLAAGKEVVFRNVTVRREGLVHRGNPILWEEIAAIDVGHNVEVKKRDGTRAYIWDVPNLTLFLLLARERLPQANVPVGPSAAGATAAG
jgi:hypothetical protein